MSRRTDDRDETPTERADRNWIELLQELRVVQTGVQILTGFLLTLPFQQRFEDLDRFQHVVYLVTFGLAVVATALIVAPVSFHRIMFREHKKEVVVRYADLFTRVGLCVLAVAVTSVALLVFDVVVGRTAGIIAATSVLGFFALAWFVVPVIVDRERESMSTEG